MTAFDFDNSIYIINHRQLQQHSQSQTRSPNPNSNPKLTTPPSKPNHNEHLLCIPLSPSGWKQWRRHPRRLLFPQKEQEAISYRKPTIAIDLSKYLRAINRIFRCHYSRARQKR